MKAFGALRLVGKYHVVEGFWRSVSMLVGLFGAIGLLFLIFLFRATADWATMSLLVVLLIMAILPIYLPTTNICERRRK